MDSRTELLARAKALTETIGLLARARDRAVAKALRNAVTYAAEMAEEYDSAVRRVAESSQELDMLYENIADLVDALETKPDKPAATEVRGNQARVRIENILAGT